MAHSFLFSSKISCMISINTVDSGAGWKTADSDQQAYVGLHFFLKRIYLCSAGQGLIKKLFISYKLG